jgi:hypothetical protein
MKQISEELKISANKIVYWMKRYGLDRRSRSEAIYLRNNPNGNPFLIKRDLSAEEERLFGFGLGIFWGDGTKKGNGVRVCNSDPKLIIKFIEFLDIICGVNKNKLCFWLQVFDDMDKEQALEYWVGELGVSKKQFWKVTVSKSRGKGNYKIKKSKKGVLTVVFNNVKLKRQIISMLG